LAGLDFAVAQFLARVVRLPLQVRKLRRRQNCTVQYELRSECAIVAILYRLLGVDSKRSRGSRCLAGDHVGRLSANAQRRNGDGAGSDSGSGQGDRRARQQCDLKSATRARRQASAAMVSQREGRCRCTRDSYVVNGQRLVAAICHCQCLRWAFGTDWQRTEVDRGRRDQHGR